MISGRASLLVDEARPLGVDGRLHPRQLPLCGVNV